MRTEESALIEVVGIARSVMRALVRLLKSWRIVSAYLTVGAAAGAFFAFGRAPEYRATARLVPYRSNQAVGGLAGLAGLAGIRLPAAGAERVLSADLYPELAKSNRFFADILRTTLPSGSGDTLPVALVIGDGRVLGPADILLRYTVGLPRLVRSLAGRAISTGSEASEVDKTAGLDVFSRQDLFQIRELRSRVSVSADKRNQVLTISARMPDPLLAAGVVVAVADSLMARIVSLESKKADEELAFVERQIGTARVRLREAQEARARFADRNRGTLSAVSQIEAEALEAEYALASEVYRQLATEREQAQIRRSQDTPVFAYIDHVSVPSEKESPRRLLTILGFLVASFAASAIHVLFVRLAHSGGELSE